MTTYPTFEPTSLFAGEGEYRSRPVLIAQAAAPTLRGTLLGRQSLATGTGAAVASAAAGNKGNGSLALDASTPVLPFARAGVYTVTFTSPTAFDVLDIEGRKLGSGETGTPYTDQVMFVAVTGSTAFAIGDGFTITVAAADIYKPCIATAADGSQVPAVVLAADTDTTGAPVIAPAYFDGTFAYEMMTVDSSWSYASLRAQLRKMGSQLDIVAV